MFIGDEEKEQIFNTVTGDDVLSYYGYLQKARRGFNPFRMDKKAGSFHKSKRGVWIDYAENERYSPVTMVAIEENLDVQSDYPKILEKLAEIGCLHFDDKPKKGKEFKKKKTVHIPSGAQRKFLGLEECSCILIYDDYNWSDTKPEDESITYRPDPNGNGYIWYNTVKLRWSELAEQDQDNVDLLIRAKALEKIWKVTDMIKKLGDTSDDTTKKILLSMKVKPVELISVYKQMRLEAFEIYRDFGGVKDLQKILSEKENRV